MVEDVDVEDFEAFSDVTGYVLVLRCGFVVAAGVVVYEDDGCGVGQDCCPRYIFHVGRSVSGSSEADKLVTDNLVVRFQEDGVEVFLRPFTEEMYFLLTSLRLLISCASSF